MAGVRIAYTAATGGDYYASIGRWSTTAGETINYTWNNDTEAWALSVSSPDDKIDLTELATGDYYAHSPNLDEYTGWICIRIHDDADPSDTIVKVDNIYIVDGAQVALEELYAVSSVVVGTGRTWKLPSDGTDALNIVSIETGSTATLAMDFSRVLNTSATLTAVSSVTVTTGSALTISNSVIDGSKTNVHFDVTAASSGDRLITVTVTTIDGQTLVGEGHLEIT